MNKVQYEIEFKDDKDSDMITVPLPEGNYSAARDQFDYIRETRNPCYIQLYYWREEKRTGVFSIYNPSRYIPGAN